MIKIVVGYFLFALSHLAYAEWEQVESPTSQRLNQVVFISNHSGFIVGNGGVVLESIDSGITWNPISTGYSASFSAVVFLNENTGFIAGSGGLILQTADGGTTWEMSSTPDTSTALSDIVFVTSAKGYALSRDGRIWRSVDSGSTWQVNSSKAYQPNGGVSPSFCFPNADTGYVAMGDLHAILKSTDGGESWGVIDPTALLPSGFATFLSGCHFFDGSSGFFVGSYYGDMVATHDGAVSLVKKGLTNSNDIYFPSLHVGYSVGGYGGGEAKLFKSEDGGENWSAQAVPDVSQLTSVHFLNADYGFAVGANGTILRTTDGGGSPTPILRPEGRNVKPPSRGGAPRYFDLLGRPWNEPGSVLIRE